VAVRLARTQGAAAAGWSQGRPLEIEPPARLARLLGGCERDLRLAPFFAAGTLLALLA